MIEINWLWLPLIITLIFAALSGIFENNKNSFILDKITITSTKISTVIYIICGIYWIITNIKFV